MTHRTEGLSRSRTENREKEMSTVIKQLTTPLGPRAAGLPMSLDEFESTEFEPGYRYELIHRVLVVTPPPLEEERDANEELGHWLRNYQES